MELSSKIERLLNEYVLKENIAGLAVGVVINNNICYAKGFGVKNMSNGTLVDSLTLFHQASISKTFVGTAIMQLVEKGKVRLDGTIIEYLPYFMMNDSRYKEITIRQLLNHTSGMPDVEDYGWDKPEYDDESLERYIKSLRTYSLLSQPGDTYCYSNIGYSILGEIIAKVSGISFEEYMQVNILKPCGMLSSTYMKVEAEDTLASPHILTAKTKYGGKISPIFPYHRAHAPSSTLYSNVEDMCKYMIMQLNRGKGIAGTSIIGSDLHKKMWEPTVHTGYGIVEESEMGLSWYLGKDKETTMVSHSGMDTGFVSRLLLLPKEKIGIAIMANADYIAVSNIAFTLLDLIRGENILYICRSMAHRLAKYAITKGIECAKEEYYRIQKDENAQYFLWEHDIIYIAEELACNGELEEAFIITKLAKWLFKDSEEIKELYEEILSDLS